MRDAATFEWTLPDPEPPEPYDVLFVLPLMGIYGGVADVLELANALVLQGVRAGVVVLEAVPPEIEMELFFRPLRLSAAELLERCPATRLLVATGYQTAVHVAAAAASRGIQTAYFVQDYEGWFGFDSPEYVAKTYDLVPRIATISSWIAREITARHGHVPTPIPISADPEVYYPRGDRPQTPPVRIAAMLRQDERRGMRYLLPALAEIASRPDVEIVLFGHARVPADAPRFPHVHLGTLQREAVPKLLSTVHVVVDPSLFQGFGLIGLEGMASGAACVLTDSGGVSEYAVDGVNALLVPPKDSAALAAGIRRLLDDPALRLRLAAAGVETARRFTWALTATRFRAFMDALPPARAVPAGERAALELLSFENRTRTALVAERHELGTTLNAIAGSRAWKAAQRLRGLRDRVAPRRAPSRARSGRRARLPRGRQRHGIHGARVAAVAPKPARTSSGGRQVEPPRGRRAEPNDAKPGAATARGRSRGAATRTRRPRAAPAAGTARAGGERVEAAASARPEVPRK